MPHSEFHFISSARISWLLFLHFQRFCGFKELNWTDLGTICLALKTPWMFLHIFAPSECQNQKLRQWTFCVVRRIFFRLEGITGASDQIKFDQIFGRAILVALPPKMTKTFACLKFCVWQTVFHSYTFLIFSIFFSVKFSWKTYLGKYEIGPPIRFCHQSFYSPSFLSVVASKRKIPTTTDRNLPTEVLEVPSVISSGFDIVRTSQPRGDVGRSLGPKLRWCQLSADRFISEWLL